MFKKILFIIPLLLVSCKPSYSFLNNYKTLSLPINNSLTFNNYKKGEKLNRRKLKKLHFDKIFNIEELHNKNNHFEIIGKPKLSAKFNTILLSSKLNQNELSSILINYSKEHQFIDYKLVSFDEITDRILRVSSEIYMDSIVSIEKNRLSGNQQKIIYKILVDGKITRQ